ncbi:hypothetical protein DFH08DRAFT_251568 [Mycena albidolilacea]|uniref:F-box domain-containing protein n=1 Tax=Mycena albidolilacea TaxID=1033008 RepID=A0AAD6ZTV5_9AGAR|nr:hypothetical protein DFH08DRAFT_251568 [Mycena albidolilacea]
MHQTSPLNVQVLLDHCLFYLHSLHDLRCCAQVSPLWVYPAQSRIFRALQIANTTWNHRLEVLASSLHLVLHIRTLHIHISTDTDALATLSTICASPFTHVDAVAFAYNRLLPRADIPPLQALLALPTVQLVKLQCTFYDPDVDHFVRLWDQASGIRHVALVCNIPQRSRAFGIDSLLPFPTPQGAIPLDALHLSSTEMLDYYLLAHSRPFNLSKLKSLSIGWRARIS